MEAFLMRLKQKFAFGLALAWSLSAVAAYAQAPPQGPVFTSPEVTPDRQVVFRILAPDAKAVSLRASDIPTPDQKPPAFTKNDQGVWEATVPPVPAGAYRYTFLVDGVATMDPRNPRSEERRVGKECRSRW